MKLKFRAKPKDLLIFVIFCIILLYLVAIAVLNIATFASDNALYGFNPIEAFKPPYLVPTLLFFGVALVTIALSVSSYFFEREKGVGITTSQKKEKGYSRWAEPKEMKKELKKVIPNAETAEYAGIPLINNGKEMWVDAGEYHNLIIGSTGSGKTQTMVFPMVYSLGKKGESMIITDPKGEIYEQTSNMLRDKGYNIILLNFRDPQRGNSWNPMALPYSLYKNGNKDKANELLDDLAMNILYDEKAQNQDPFWEKTSADYFTGLSLALFDDAKEEEINLNSINLMTTQGEEKFAASTYIKEYFNTKDPSSPAYINASSTLMAPSDTKGSILAVFKQKIKLFSSRENLSEMLSHSDFDMKDIGKKKTAVFIVIQDEKKTYHSLVTIFIKQCYETLIDVAQESGGKLEYKTNFILDEFANMPPLKDVTTMVTAARSRAIRFTFIIQNFAQLYQVYGKENGETIKGNCGNIIYLISSEIAALEEISKMCGEVKSKEKDKTASTPLVTVSDLQRMSMGETVILRTRMMPFKTKLTFNYKMDWGKNYDKALYPSREKQPVALFNLKALVEKQKEEKINQMLNGMNSNKPSMPTFPSMSGLPPINNLTNDSKPSGGFDVDELVKKIDAKIAELEEEERRENEQKKAQEIKPEEPIIGKTRFDELFKDLDEEVEEPILEKHEEIKPEVVEKEDFIDIPVEKEETKEIVSDNIVETKEEKQPKENVAVENVFVESEKINKTVENEPNFEKYEEKIESNPVSDVTDDQFFDDFFSDDDEF